MVRPRTDAVDERILSELQADARIPLVTLAARVHLSRNAVKHRMERMERDGLIAGYTLARPRVDDGRVTAIVLVYRADRMRGAGVITELTRIPEVVQCDILSGQFDLLVTIRAESMERIGQIWERIAALPEVSDTVTSVSLTRVIDRA